ncbi:DUF2085 domain-containing protein [Halarchaeum salinum]|uniref:DUF2085 domain-containing protein n=1 Tax=Halarchaeum salinum TaxID=489912 RepID=UPI0031D66F07
MKIDISEFRRGVRRTRYYALSHHERDELYRCYTVTRFGRPRHLCARCTGVYPGIILGILAFMSASTTAPWLLLIGVLPAPALIDWTITSLVDCRGYNVARTITGSLLGSGYGLGVAHLVHSLDVRVLAIGVGYAVCAAIFLAIYISSDSFG